MQSTSNNEMSPSQTTKRLLISELYGNGLLQWRGALNILLYSVGDVNEAFPISLHRFNDDSDVY